MIYNKSSTFLFPLLEISKSIFDCNVRTIFGKKILDNRLLHVAMWDEDIEMDYNYDPFLLLTIDPFQDTNFDVFYDNIINHVNYVDEYEKNHFIIMIFQIPNNNIKDYNTLLEGSYSKISKNSKNLIKNNAYCEIEIKNALPLILNKSPKLKKNWEDRLSNPDSPAFLNNQEVWTIIDKNEEKLNNKLLKKLEQKRNIYRKSQIKVKHTCNEEDNFGRKN